MAVDKKKWIGQTLVILAGVLWGCIGIFSRALSAYGISSFQIGLIRAVVATSVLLTIIAIKDRKLFKIDVKDIWIFICMGVVGFSLLSVCYMTSIVENSLSVACVLMYTAPIWVMLASAWLFKEKLNLVKVISILACFLGCVAICSSSSIKMTPFGFLMGMGSALTYASYSIFGKLAAKKGYSPLTSTFYAFLFAALSLLPFANVGGLVNTFVAEPKSIWAALGIGTLSTVIPFLIYTIGLSLMDASKAAVFAIVDPMVAAIVGAIAFSEAITVWTVVGIIVIFAGLFLQSRGEPSPKNGQDVEDKKL